LEILVDGSEANRATAGNLPQPRPTENFNRRTSLILRTDNLLAGKLILPFAGGCLPLCCPALLSLWELFRVQAERGSGISLKLFGFIAESVFTFISEHLFGFLSEP
jgi:hypothetical protein